MKVSSPSFEEPVAKPPATLERASTYFSFVQGSNSRSTCPSTVKRGWSRMTSSNGLQMPNVPSIRIPMRK